MFETYVIEEKFRFLLADNLREFSADLELTSRVSCPRVSDLDRAPDGGSGLLTADEVLHAVRQFEMNSRPLLDTENTHFIQPPKPAPRRITSSPFWPTILVPDTFKYAMGCSRVGCRK